LDGGGKSTWTFFAIAMAKPQRESHTNNLGKFCGAAKIGTLYGIKKLNVKNETTHICVALATGLTRKPLIFQPNADCSSTRQMARLGALSAWALSGASG
jgi:hypothetical protein